MKKAIFLGTFLSTFLSNFYRTQVYLGSDLWVLVSLTHTPFADLTNVTLADEDTNSILIDNANRAIQGNASYATWWPTLQTMQMVPTDDQILNQCKLCHILAKFATNASGAIWWSKLQLM